MSLLGVVLLVALSIPILSLLVDGPVGRALARRMEREPTPATRRDELIADLKQRLDQLEGDLELLNGAVTDLREESEALHRRFDVELPRPPEQR